MLVEEGFTMVSVDASDKMLKYALKARWDRRKEPAFDQWGMNGLFSFLKRVYVQIVHGTVTDVHLSCLQ